MVTYYSPDYRDPVGSAAGPLLALPTGGCDLHPTLRGHRALARAVAGAAAS